MICSSLRVNRQQHDDFIRRNSLNAEQEILSLLQTFQEGYTRRDLSILDSFMELFTPNAEVIGTNGIRPGEGEWYPDRISAKALVQGDWESWGDLQLEMVSASIHAQGNVGWLTAPATVIQIIGNENYEVFLKFIREFLDSSTLPAEEKLHYILRGGTNTVYELRRGEKFVWALRLTAVVVKEENQWKFAQMHFSFPTIYFPDVRIFPNET